MIKVLIVDDDILARNKLRSIIEWENHDFVICGEAGNGSDAIPLLAELEPQIVILDVSMPIMGGVELSSFIFKNYTEVKIIMLSSYDNFDYVRETMKNGAIDYLLKHSLDGAELLAILDKVKNKILAESIEKKEIKMVTQKWDLVRSELFQKYIRELVLEIPSDKESIKEYFEDNYFNLKSVSIIVVSMQLTNFAIINERYTNKDRSVLINSVTDLCNSILQTLKNGKVAYIDQGRFVFLFSFENNIRSESNLYQQLQSYMDKIGNTIGKFLKVSAIFGHSMVCKRVEEIPQAYEKAVEKMENQLFQNLSKNDIKSQRITLTIPQEKRLINALDAIDSKEVLLALEEIFSELKADGVDYNSIQIIISEFIRIANKLAQSKCIMLENVFEWENIAIEKLKQCKTIDEIKECIFILFSKLFNEINKHRIINIKSKYIKEAISFINKNYTHDISMEDVAEKVGLSPAYFSKLFKDDCGSTFSEYLNNIRIEASKNLIIKGEKKAKNIFSKVGFNNYNYFLRVFKENTGLTPMAYAEHLEKKN